MSQSRSADFLTLPTPPYRVRWSWTMYDGFAAWIPGTNISAYAYDTSPHAEAARDIPEAVAHRMIANTLEGARLYVTVCGYERMRDRHESLMREVLARE